MNDRILDDGFGNVWETCEHEDCGLEIVRPGKVQCNRCSYENVRRVMSEQRHIYAWTEWHGAPVVVAVDLRSVANADAKRYTLTEGSEWSALMDRAREVLATPDHKDAMRKAEALRDLLIYFGEQT
jgi:hypothetical protein